MRSYAHQFQVKASLQRVNEFHRNPAGLKLLTPPPMFISVKKAEPLQEGSVVDFVLWFGPIPIRWVAVHSEVNPEQGFIDIQQTGPFKLWKHSHRFKAGGGGKTEITDEIQAEFGEGFWYGLVSRFMWLNLPILFAYRTWKTRRILRK